MGSLLLIVGLMLSGVSVVLSTYALLSGHNRLSLVPRRRRASMPLEGTKPGVRLLNAVRPIADPLTPLGNVVTEPRIRRWVAETINQAGLRHAYSVNDAIAAAVVLAVALPVATACITGTRSPLLLAGSAAAGAMLPGLILRDRRRQRVREIVRRLPGCVDVLSLSVEAGLDFLIAVRRIVERGEPNALRDELATLLQDVRLGQTRTEALKGLARRVQTPEIGDFCAVLVQADLLGASIGTALKALASGMRAQRFQRAEKAGAQAAQKMRLPLMAFIFPAVLLVILAIALGPAIVELLRHTAQP